MIDAYVWTTPNGQKLLIALEELGLPYRLKWIDIGKGDQKQPEFLAINPNNKIPAIVDGTTKVFESGAVLTYLARKAGAWPSPDHVALEWMFFNAGGTGPMIGQLGYHKKYGPKRDPEQIERFTKEVDRLFGVLDRRLGESTFLAGDSYTVVDMMNFTWPNAAVTNLDFDATKHVNVTRWLAEINARPAVKKALALKP
jgi:GST-like protein